VDDIVDGFDFSGKKIGQGVLRFEKSEQQMDVGPAEIKVNETDFFAASGEQEGKVGDDHGLAGAAFA
jgi:hypothetical protein